MWGRQQIIEKEERVLALSLSRPWDYVILHCGKDVENRVWPTSYRGRICVHRAKSWDEDGYRWLITSGLLPFSQRGILGARHSEQEMVGSAGVMTGLVGEVDVTDCVTKSDSPWFFGPYGFILANPKAYDKVIPCRGALKLWTVPTTNGMIGGMRLP